MQHGGRLRRAGRGGLLKGRTAAILAGGGLLGLGAAITIVGALLAEPLHTLILQRVAQSGLARSLNVSLQPGWLTTGSQGELELARPLCRRCTPLRFEGEMLHGLGAWREGIANLAVSRHQVTLPAPPELQPQLPLLHLKAQPSLPEGLRLDLHWPASAHDYQLGRKHWQIRQAGLEGRVTPGAFALQMPRLALARNQQDWLGLTGLSARASADDSLQISAQAEQAQAPFLRWHGADLRANYTQDRDGELLAFDLGINAARGSSGGRPHQQTGATLNVDRLNWPAVSAFAREMPRLLDSSTPAGSRMFGLLSLYSLHGAALFAPSPDARLDLSALPLPAGAVDGFIRVAVRRGTRRAPMHPAEWRHALIIDLDLRAPESALRALWQQYGQILAYATALPRSSQALLDSQWTTRTDGRVHFRYQQNTG